MIYLVILYSLLLAVLVFKNWQLGLAWLFLVLPSYFIRFNFLGLPSTILEVTFGVVFLVWLIKYAKDDFKNIAEILKTHKILTAGLALFFLGSIIGILTKGKYYYSLGQWRAYFFEPMILFFMIVGRLKYLDLKYLLWPLAIATFPVSSLAIIQKIFGSFYAPSLWDDQLFGRVTSFYTTPNAIGLFCVPLFFLTLLVYKKYSQNKFTKSLAIILGLLNLIALFFSFSQGAWIALGAGFFIFLYAIGFKKMTVAIILIGIVSVFSLPSLKEAVLFQDKSGQNRLKLWSYTFNYLVQSPQNFILGAGVGKFFEEVYYPQFKPKEMERLIYPHNIFLNFWSEIGLIGLSGFLFLVFYWLKENLKIYQNDKYVGAILLAIFTSVIVHGLVDAPYFKNDLAILFWCLFGVLILASKKYSVQNN